MFVHMIPFSRRYSWPKLLPLLYLVHWWSYPRCWTAPWISCLEPWCGGATEPLRKQTIISTREVLRVCRNDIEQHSLKKNWYHTVDSKERASKALSLVFAFAIVAGDENGPLKVKSRPFLPAWYAFVFRIREQHIPGTSDSSVATRSWEF